MSLWWINDTQLDDDQKRVVKLDAMGRFVISGPPGSGKTNLLLLRANYLYRRDNRNFSILSFTGALKSFLTSGAARYGVFPAEKVDTTVGWMMRALSSIGGSLDNLSPDLTVRRTELAKRLHDQMDARTLEKVHDTLLLDEAQDYTAEEIAVFARCAPNLFIVGDDRQLLYERSAGMKAVAATVRATEHILLRFHYRNSPEVCALADRFAKDDKGHIPIKPTCNYKGPPGQTRVRRMPLQQQFQEILAGLRIQLASYPKEPLGVLCTRLDVLQQFWDHIAQSDLAGLANNLQDRVWDDDLPIVCGTVHSAKGLEFRAVHLPAFERNKGREQRNIAYTAVTRAKTTLEIYHEEDFAGWLGEALRDEADAAEEPGWGDIFGRRS